MKTFRDGAPKDQVRWLLFHGIVLGGVYGLVFLAAVRGYSRIERDTTVQYFIAVPGIALATAAGIAMAWLCIARLRKPFDAQKMRIDMAFYVVAELIVLFLTGFLLVPVHGIMARFLITLFLVTNFSLLVTIGRLPTKGPPPSPLA